MIQTTQSLRLQLEKEPASPEKIKKLVLGRGSMPMDEIADLVTKTKDVTCLIPLAYPRVAAREGATVETATNRLGVNRVISIMLLNLLNATVQQVFKDNVGMVLQKKGDSLSAVSDAGYIICTIPFSGDAKGVISFCYLPQTSHDVAAVLTDPATAKTPNHVNERIADLGYYIADLFLKQMAEADLACNIEGTTVEHRLVAPKETVKEGTNDSAYFHCGARHVSVHLGIQLTKAVEDRRSEFGIS